LVSIRFAADFIIVTKLKRRHAPSFQRVDKLRDTVLSGHPASVTDVLVRSLAGRPSAWSRSFLSPLTTFPTVKKEGMRPPFNLFFQLLIVHLMLF